MYYPLLRGKLNELLAIRETLPKLHANGRICPIIEPVTSGTSRLVACLTAIKGQIPHVVLVNPSVGKLKRPAGAVDPLIAPFLVAGNNLIPGFNIGKTTTLPQLNSFLNTYRNRKVMLLFCDPPAWFASLPAALRSLPVSPILAFVDGKVPITHVATFAGFDLALIRDGFQRKDRNDLYPRVSQFGDLHLTYAAAGYQGFGDYSIVGFTFRDGGGPAKTVTIHLTEDMPARGPIIVNHFKSTSVTATSDTAGKFQEALNYLVAHLRASPRFLTYSTACAEFVGLHGRRHFPQLGPVKKLSMKHHLELMETLV